MACVLPGMVEFRVTTPIHPSAALVLVALEPTLIRYPHGLPPLLADPVILGAGVCDKDGFTLTLPETNFPAGIFIYGQGVVAGDEILTTTVDDFVLDETGDR